MLVVLAGSLTLSHLPDVLPLEPDYVAVRGAVCEGTRTGDVRVHLVQQWSRVLRSTPVSAKRRDSLPRPGSSTPPQVPRGAKWAGFLDFSPSEPDT